ncbi:thiamine-phosphate kinase [Brevibacillus sp. SYSU BS000544]|uniref:thiamine-phosphate kinase n=1 Tax=Brevibacillus sp. SYSU BS000544 TaxID=3416443 RepID=UPI003CE589B6
MMQDEFSLIKQWTRESKDWPRSKNVSVGIGDDAAVFSVSNQREVVACCDAMIETVHFLKQTMKPSDIGYKSVISNISDIAAMGGIPLYALVTIGISPNWSASECQEIYEGIYDALREYHVQLIGGDTVSTPDALHLSVTLLGEVERGKAFLRSKANPGDIVFVTGTLGDSAAGLHLLLAEAEKGDPSDDKWKDLRRKHQRPSAQVTTGRLLHQLEPMGALNDISDGLASELWEIAEASHVSILIEEDEIPLSQTLLDYCRSIDKDPYEWAWTGGEDYQLVGTVPESEYQQLKELCVDHNLFITCIGRVQKHDQQFVRMIDRYGRERVVEKTGYNHFAT